MVPRNPKSQMLDALPCNVFCLVTSHCPSRNIKFLQVNRATRDIIASQKFWALYMAFTHGDASVPIFNDYLDSFAGSGYSVKALAVIFVRFYGKTTLVRLVLSKNNNVLQCGTKILYSTPNSFIQERQFMLHNINEHATNGKTQCPITFCDYEMILSFVNKNAEWELAFFLNTRYDRNLISALAARIIVIHAVSNIKSNKITFHTTPTNGMTGVTHILSIQELGKA